MAINFNPDNVASGYNLSKINDNFQKAKTALADGLSRTGGGPNQMMSDLDMNSNDILNIKTLQVEDITVDGTNPTGILQRAVEAVEEAEAFAEISEDFSIDAAASAAEAANYASLVKNNWATAARFTATGVEQDVALSVDPGSDENMFVIVGNTVQPPGGVSPPFSLVYVGTTAYIRITAPTGVSVVVRVGSAIAPLVPSDNSVNTNKIVDGAVTTPKIADANVTYSKIQNISSTLRLLGRKTAGAGPTEEISSSDLLAFLPTGSVLQSRNALFTGRGPFTVVIPFDDTVPLLTEGTEILTLSFTPLLANSKLRIRFQGDANAEIGSVIGWAAFVDSTCVMANYAIADQTGYPRKISGEADFTIANTTAKTISVRVGPESNTKNIRFAGPSTTRVFGGASAATLVVEEIKG